jgi:hypothetical protein
MFRSVALVTCRELPGLDEDTRHLFAPLAARGIRATAAVWDDTEVDWNGFDLVVVRSCWDYVSRLDKFLEWAARIPNLANPATVLAWNTHKGYLRELADRGVPIVPTRWLPPGEEWTPPEGGDWVIKPAVSLASLDAGRYRMDDRHHRRLAVEHVRRLHAREATVMVQPYLHSIDDEGETSFVYLGGVFSHAMRKAAVLTGPDEGVDRRFLPQGGLHLRAHRPTTQEIVTANQVLAAVPAARHQLLYARVDLVSGPDGCPLLWRTWRSGADGRSDRGAHIRQGAGAAGTSGSRAWTGTPYRWTPPALKPSMPRVRLENRRVGRSVSSVSSSRTSRAAHERSASSAGS